VFRVIRGWPPFLVVGTDRVALLQERIARRIAATPDLRILDCPFDVVPLVEAFWWHPVYTHDLEHTWLRDLLPTVFPDADSPAARGLL
jgi:hypothetical protein